MDFVLDYISVNTFWTILSTTHALLAVALLGALTHQAAAVLAPPRAGATGGFVTHFRSVSGPRYAAAVCVLWVLVFIFGAWIYVRYRVHVRVFIEQEGLWKTVGAFDLKEQLVQEEVDVGVGIFATLDRSSMIKFFSMAHPACTFRPKLAIAAMSFRTTRCSLT